MNGEAGGDGGGRVVTSQPATSFLRTGSTPSSYSSSPRLRRLDDMKKSYLGGSTGGGGGTAISNAVTTTTATYNSKYTSSGNTYRLASLDRLAQRHKLYDASGVTNDSNSSSNTNSVNSSPSTTPRDTPRDMINVTTNFHHSSIPAPVAQPIVNQRERFPVTKSFRLPNDFHVNMNSWKKVSAF
ncbi:hypothetical protein SK128_028479 [Halocaridina rubra]|uniref:Uncharacterized protein n=1 Tax=Halocaridina rubra TaxID=373956 RepID=A0AAN8WLQ9_HALRR